MGVANSLPVNENAVDLISSFVGRPWSVVGTSNGGAYDIANMDDVSESTISILHQGKYHEGFINRVLYAESLAYPNRKSGRLL